jgi:hypothetical protein
MVRPPMRKRIRGTIILVLAVGSSSGAEAETEADLDQRIRRIVNDVMKEKDAEIAGLKARVQELESQLRQMPKTPEIRESKARAPVRFKEPSPREPPAMAAAPPHTSRAAGGCRSAANPR